MPPTAPINRHQVRAARANVQTLAQCSYSMLWYSNKKACFEHSNLLKVTTKSFIYIIKYKQKDLMPCHGGPVSKTQGIATGQRPVGDNQLRAF